MIDHTPLRFHPTNGSVRFGFLDFVRKASSSRRQRAAAFCLLSAWFLVAFWPPSPVSSPERSWSTPELPAPPLPPVWYEALAERAGETVSGELPPGSSLARLLAGLDVPPATLADVLEVAGDGLQLDRLRAGQPYEAYLDHEADLLGLRFQHDLRSALVIGRHKGQWRVEQVTLPYDVRPRFVDATVRDTLVASLSDAPHVGRRLSWELAARIERILAWEVDFSHDLRRGDRVELLVEERWIGDQLLGYGDILVVRFDQARRTLTAVRFQDATGKVRYYRPDGDSLQRTFLMSPVTSYERISSRFSNRRLHPVLGYRRAHRGVDFVADRGTAVQATADGVVVATGYGQQAGRYVKVRHGGGFTSSYLHLLKIADGIRRGTQVRLGQTIGYVGKTGLASGYHVHYGLTLNGRYVDPLDVDFPAADPLPETLRAQFESQRDRLLAMFEQYRGGSQAVVAGG